jgi:hypothetical protein
VRMIDLKLLVQLSMLSGLILVLCSCNGQNGSQEERDSIQEVNTQVAQGESRMNFYNLVHDFCKII